MPSLFLGVYTAIYGYTPQSDKEIAFDEGDLLCVLEKPADDDWWKAKKKGNSVDDEEPVGLIPNNYIEEAKPIGKYRALYDYTQQTEEELSFSEDDVLDVYDNSDPDWALVGLSGRYGYAPANYIEKAEDSSPAPEPTPVALPVRKQVAFTEEPESPIVESPAPAQRSMPPAPVSPPLPDRSSYQPSPRESVASPVSASFRPESTYNREEARTHERPAPNRNSKSHKSQKSQKSAHYYSDDDSDGPGLPLRRPGDPPYRAGKHESHDTAEPPIPPGFRTYPVMEVDSKKKRAATLGLGPNRIILLPDKSSRPREEWTIDNMTGYNHEGKHVFLEVKGPNRSLDLHAGSTQTAEEIISTLGELKGIQRVAGFDEVIAAVNGGKKADIGTVLYDFPAQGQDEVSCTAGDEVVILDDSNGEWWLVRRQVNGVEGVLPSSYVERGRKNIVASAGIKESPAIRSDARKSQHIQASSSTGDVPERRSSLAAPPQSRKPAPSKSSMPQPLRYKRERPSGDRLLTVAAIEPDTTQLRTWTDRSASFKVEAQFLGCRDGKIHLHKINGVKIAVPVSKMSMADLRYVEEKTGMCLDEDKPLSEIMKERRQNGQSGSSNRSSTVPATSAFGAIKKSDYDWFTFFLGCGVDVNNCQRYTTNFEKEEMDESCLEDITPEIMRTLGLKEGDILRVSKKLDERYGRVKVKGSSDDTGSSLFTDEHGNLKSSRPRPPPATQVGAVDPKALQTQKDNLSQAPTPVSRSPPLQETKPTEQTSSGFDDNAWEPKPVKSQPSQQQQPAPVQQPNLTGAFGDLANLSLDTPPLQPNVLSPPPAPQPAPGFSAPPPSTQPAMGYSPAGPTVGYAPAGRMRPAAPSISPTPTASLGIAPPPTRPLSAPQTFMAPSAQPMQPTFTGAPSQPMQSAFTGAPNQPMQSAFTGAPNQMNYNPMGAPTMQPMMTGAPGGMGGMVPQLSYQNTGMGSMGQFPNGGFPQSGYQMPMQQQMTGMQPHMTGMQPQMPGMQPQMTGMQPNSFNMFSSAQPNNTLGINNRLPPPLIPQNTAAPLQPQQTGPAPPVRFGVAQTKLTPQPTGRANLTKATPDNPFGF